jgi:predicted GNAT family N-acyltransferase
MNIDWRVVPHQSEWYVQSLALRDWVLRKPLGLLFEPADLHGESVDVHVVGIVDTCVVACCILSHLKQAHAFKMRQVAVLESQQRRGLGRQLVNFCEHLAIQERKSSLVLHAREGAVPFYLALGYETEGAEFMEVGIPHRRMMKLVDANPSR